MHLLPFSPDVSKRVHHHKEGTVITPRRKPRKTISRVFRAIHFPSSSAFSVLPLRKQKKSTCGGLYTVQQRVRDLRTHFKYVHTRSV